MVPWIDLEIGKWVKEKQLHDGFDEEYQSFILNEDKVVDALEPVIEQGFNVVDHHGSDFFPERFFDLVIVLTCDIELLFPRLEKRFLD